MRTFARFCIVGAIGFVADSGTTILMVKGAGWTPFWARIAAFLGAATVTWVLNRAYTFRAAGGLLNWLSYVIATSVGALINVAVYLCWIRLSGTDSVDLFMGVAAGSAVALVFNFGVARALIFRSVPRR